MEEKKKEVMEYIKKVDCDTIVQVCNEIHNWRYGNGVLRPDAKINEICRIMDFWDLRILEEYIVLEAQKRFHKTVLLLVKDSPRLYFR